MKLVLAHDSLTQLGGAERVFLCLAEMFPDAPIYTLVLDKEISKQLPTLILRRIRVTKLQWLYNVFPKFQYLLPFIPMALWWTRLPECDVLLSSSSAFAKGFKVSRKQFNNLTSKYQDRNKTTHINYCHTPTRFLWSDGEYMEQEVPWVVRWPAKLFLWWMKQWDLQVARRVDVFIANSKEVQARIKKYYGRESEVVYPFVDTEFWKPSSLVRHPESASGEGSFRSKSEILQSQSLFQNDRESKQNYFLIAGRLHAHKHNDMVIEVCNELGLNLHVVGSGRDEAHLKSIAGLSIKFLGRITDEQLREEYANAQGYIYPQLEDFGLMPLEAAACGTPTIGVDEGGSRETIVPGVTGEWFTRGSKEELKRILLEWHKGKYSAESLRKHAEKFSKSKFIGMVGEMVANTLNQESSTTVTQVTRADKRIKNPVPNDTAIS